MEFNERFDMFLKFVADDLGKELRRVAPFDEGYLRNHIKVIAVHDGIEIYMPEYALYVEFGTKPHVIRPKLKKALKFESGKKARLESGKSDKNIVFAKEVRHPGTKPQPFIRNTFYHKLKGIVQKNAEMYVPEVAEALEVSIA